jgi:hypothetical protein
VWSRRTQTAEQPGAAIATVQINHSRELLPLPKVKSDRMTAMTGSTALVCPFSVADAVVVDSGGAASCRDRGTRARHTGDHGTARAS